MKGGIKMPKIPDRIMKVTDEFYWIDAMPFYTNV